MLYTICHFLGVHRVEVSIGEPPQLVGLAGGRVLPRRVIKCAGVVGAQVDDDSIRFPCSKIIILLCAKGGIALPHACNAGVSAPGISALLLRRWFRKDQSRVDAARAEWVNGVSHDIRTPLSMVLGYTSELEDDCDLPPNARKQAGIIRRESEKMKRLIDDLNLTTKLEYALQPVHFKDVDWVETSRQAVSEVLNGGLDSRYEIAFAEMQPGRSIHLLGDDGLLRRMLDNLIRNSITHNPQGCKISVSVGEENGRCLCTVSDDGIGIAPERLKVLNRGDDITSTQGSDEKNEHGLGLKLVMQIVKAHRGTVSFSGSTPHGLEVRISLPTQPLIS